MHLKNVALSLLIIHSMIGFTQEKKLEYSLDYSIGSSFRRIGVKNPILAFREAEKPITTHGFNLQVKYCLSERLGIVSGLGYNQYGEAIEFSNLTFGNMIDPRIGFVYDPTSPTVPTSFKTKYVYQFFSLPLLLDYSIINREKSALAIQFGLSFNYLIGSRSVTKIDYSDGSKDRNSANYSFDSNDLNFAGLLGIFYKRNLGEKYFFKVGPQVNYFFSSISGSDAIDHYPYRTSINLGIGF
ncbi:MAG: outer membrane beta-barrel protein [Cytophagales bacterium]